MTDFVMVAGAWLGAWAWDEVAADLRAAGHGVHPLTLSGLAEKQGVREPGQQTHVQDVVDEVERLDPRDVVLVGHSYSGVPVGQAAVRIGDRLRHVVLVDANAPVDGESFLSGWPSDEVRAAIAANGGCWPPLTAEEYAGQGLTDEQIARIVEATPHPGATLTEPAVMPRPLNEVPGTYVKCLLDGAEPWGAAAELLKSERWRLVNLDTGHWPMFSEPHALARILHESVTAP
ncbi:alpha/beta fold hydrolase [Streptomyces sp. NPDC098781]|uniref:alpha/beta fold hydrolase n=1 Tax=Streptomyces sp. NPDC098781 TaxID=3366097 RepID=UPI0037F7E321